MCPGQAIQRIEKVPAFCHLQTGKQFPQRTVNVVVEELKGQKGGRENQEGFLQVASTSSEGGSKEGWTGVSKCKEDRQNGLLRTGSRSGKLVEEERREVIREGAKEVRGTRASRACTPGGSKQGE